MKTWSTLALSILIAGCTKTNIISREFGPENTVHYSQLHTLETVPTLTNYAVYVDAGDTLPLELSVDTDIIAIEDQTIDTVAKQKIYFMLKPSGESPRQGSGELETLSKKKLSEMSESERARAVANVVMYISNDAREWAPVGDMRAMKEIFGTKSGTVSFGMGMSQKEGLRSYLRVREIR